MGKHAKKTPIGRKIMKWTGGVLSVALLAGVGFAGYTYIDTNKRLQENSIDIGATIKKPTVLDKTKEEPTKDLVNPYSGGFTTLLVGSDDGNGMTEKYGVRDHSLNDVTIVMHVSEDHKKATAISIPRDMLIDYPECEADGVTYEAEDGAKVNTALSRGGLKCAVEAIASLTNEPIEYAAMIQFEGVIEMSNAVGGVPVCIASPIKDPYTGLELEAGEQLLSGDNALNFLRTRHGVGDGSDLGRISNQQLFLSSLMRTLKSSETLTNPLKLYNLSQVAINNMTLSSNMANIETIASLAYSLKDINLSEVSFLQYPTTFESSNGVDNLVPNYDDAQVMLDAVFSDQSVAITGGTAPGDIGAIDESEATVDPTPTDVSTTVEPDSSIPSTVAPDGSIILPESVTGQNAEQITCSNGVS